MKLKSRETKLLSGFHLFNKKRYDWKINKICKKFHYKLQILLGIQKTVNFINTIIINAIVTLIIKNVMYLSPD